MKLMLNKDNSLSVNSVEVIKWVDGYQPPAGGDDSAETDGSDSGETGPETGVPLALGAVLALALAVTVLAVTGKSRKNRRKIKRSEIYSRREFDMPGGYRPTMI